MELWQLYLIEVIPSVVSAAQAIIGISFALLTIMALFSVAVFESYAPEENSLVRLLIRQKKLIATSAIAFVLLFAVPSHGGMYRIIGGYVATNIEGIQELPQNLINAANDWAKSVSDTSE